MQTKLAQGKYQTMDSFAQDVYLVFKNCRQFNPPTTYPTNCADAVEKVFQKEWAKATENKLTSAEKRTLLGVLNKTWAYPECVPS